MLAYSIWRTKMYDENELAVMKQFDSYIKKCIKNIAYNYENKNKNKWHNHTLFFEDCSDIAFEPDSYESSEDNYFEESKIYNVNGILIEVTDSNIIKALEYLPTKLRTIVLLYYFDDKTDKQIGLVLNSIQQTINNQRKEALELMKKFLKNTDEQY
jgi:RNA polymerase sigma factor (sigma-70 family)